MTDSIEYYDQNAQEFFDGTVGVDMSELYDRFLPLVPDGGSILDAGCGSGRDAVAFQSKGYEVTAFDASRSLCELASEQLGKPVHCLRFEEIEWQRAFDGVWACASLLHVQRANLKEAFEVLLGSLKPKGVMYCSFKLGDKGRSENGRIFTDMTAYELQRVLKDIFPDLTLEIWVTEDQRPNRSESWLNALIFM